MSLTLSVDVERWHRHHTAVLAKYPHLVPVVKGNGYGFGNRRLIEEAVRLQAREGVDTLAVGTAAEAALAKSHFSGRIIVLNPYLPGEDPDVLPNHVVRTVASAEGVKALAGRRVVVDCVTSMRRHGVSVADLGPLRSVLDDVTVDGYSVHLPLERPAGVDPAREVGFWVTDLERAGLTPETMYVSHLRSEELAALAEAHPGTVFRPRIGTELWLGDSGALTARATVLDVHPLEKGERYGYRQQKARSSGYLVVVSGGTAHGVGLDAPKHVSGPVSRAKVLARAGLAVMNRTQSPFSWRGKQLWFAEPPHMLVSLLLLPAGVTPPIPGEEVTAELRHTTTHFDAVVEG